MLAAAACATPAPRAPAADDCAIVRLWSNGWHTNFSFEADLLAPDDPLRAAHPEARFFLVGWGERDFYMAGDAGFWKGFKAIVPPSPAVMQVFAGEDRVEDKAWPGTDLAPMALTRGEAERLARAVSHSLRLDETGAPVPLGEGRISGQSRFYAARGNFHLFNMCNHWSARRLKEAGLPMRALISFTAPALMDAARRKTARSCAPPV